MIASETAPGQTQNLMTVREVAAMLNVSVTSIYRLVERRSIPFHRLPRGLRFHPDDVRRFLDKCREEPANWQYERI